MCKERGERSEKGGFGFGIPDDLSCWQMIRMQGMGHEHHKTKPSRARQGVVRAMANVLHCHCISRPRCARTSQKGDLAIPAEGHTRPQFGAEAQSSRYRRVQTESACP